MINAEGRQLTPEQQQTYEEIHRYVMDVIEQNYIGQTTSLKDLQHIEKIVKKRYGIDIEATFFADDPELIIIKPFVNQLLELDKKEYSID